ncbi:MAG: hypothetical protein F4X20_07930 [Dehalococcoidia bacterium]|nr:hypothetical protein [Dehalococcoidia bacterium]
MADDQARNEAPTIEAESKAHIAEERLEQEASALEDEHGTLELIESGHDDRVWQRVLHAALAVPGVKVDRENFLRSTLKSIADEEQIEKAVETRPVLAGIDNDQIDSRANVLIRKHVTRASGISFAAGIPGGFAMLGTIPADLAQYFFHMTVMAQELAYLYGWPDLLHEGELDEIAQADITMFIGAMMGVGAAKQGLQQLSARAVTHHASSMLAKRVGRYIGVKITKDTFTRGFAKAIPLLGGFIGAGMTASTMLPMARRLRQDLAQLDYALAEDPIEGHED